MAVFKRLFCSHYFLEDHLVEAFPDPKVLLHCAYCKKEIVRRASQTPVNPIIETEQEYYERMVKSGNAHLTMRPIIGTESKPHLSLSDRETIDTMRWG